MDPVIVIIISLTCLSVLYCIGHWMWIFFTGRSVSGESMPSIVLASYDARLSIPDVPVEELIPGLEYERPPPDYEEAMRVYEEAIARFGLRQRNSDDVRRDDYGQEISPPVGEEHENGEDRQSVGKNALNEDEL